jgi:hypothetical protein
MKNVPSKNIPTKNYPKRKMFQGEEWSGEEFSDEEFSRNRQAAAWEAFLALERETNKVGLKINERRPKYTIAA